MAVSLRVVLFHLFLERGLHRQDAQRLVKQALLLPRKHLRVAGLLRDSSQATPFPRLAVFKVHRIAPKIARRLAWGRPTVLPEASVNRCIECHRLGRRPHLPYNNITYFEQMSPCHRDVLKVAEYDITCYTNIIIRREAHEPSHRASLAYGRR